MSQQGFTLLIATLILFAGNCANAETQWQPLLDAELSQWETYLGYPNSETEAKNLAKNEEGAYTQPVGYNRDEWGVFTVSEASGEPVLRISGEVYGGIFTKQDFGNYHLQLQVKWGSKKWPPRLEKSLDSGILYHGNGEHGIDYWKAWPLSQEFQIIQHSDEGTTGDWWKIADSQIKIACSRASEESPYQYTAGSPPLDFGGEAGVSNTCRASHNNEKPKGEWNTLDLFTYEGKSLHIVNGEVVMALSESAYPEKGQVHPLITGRIVLQSEAGEVFFRRIKIKSIKSIPVAYQSFFEE